MLSSSPLRAVFSTGVKERESGPWDVIEAVLFHDHGMPDQAAIKTRERQPATPRVPFISNAERLVEIQKYCLCRQRRYALPAFLLCFLVVHG